MHDEAKQISIAISMHEVRLHSPLVVVMDGATVTDMIAVKF